MKTTIEFILFRQQDIARSLANSLANEFGLFNTASIEKRQPVGQYIINQRAMPSLNSANLMVSLMGIQLN